MICFEVVGEIVPKGRPRITMFNSYPHLYTPNNTRQYENLIKDTVIAKGIKGIGDKRFKISIDAYFKIPKSTSNKKRQQMINAYCDKKKDIDNIAKVVLDALNGVLYDDDRNCVSLNACKWYGEEEKLIISIERIE